MNTHGVSRPVKTRRLSPWRVLLAITVIACLAASVSYGWREWRVSPEILSNDPWFAPYIDVTAVPQFNFEQLGATAHKDAILSFIVADKKHSCEPTWGGEYTLAEASSDLDLDRRIARLKQQGGSISVSFGGLKNNELASACSDESKLLQAYTAVVDRYDLTTIDLDLELEALTDSVTNARRAKVIAQLQQARRKAGRPFAVWATIPVTPEGLNKDGTDAIATLLGESVDISGINLMTMNYGEASIDGKKMSDVAIEAVNKTRRQISILYSNAGTNLNDATLWRKIGITPMIGQTDVRNEIFTLADAKRLNEFGLMNHAGRMSMWSANRDVECGSNYIDTKIVSAACSGTKQHKFGYMLALGRGFIGTINGNADTITVSEETELSSVEITDDPLTSPYSIWSKSGIYLQGTKVTWHRNVYQAKWWTEGEAPDNPVLQAFQTPWELIGPVMDGEAPIAQLGLPEGTYPEWDGEAIYTENQRVLFQSIPYQAKWWNRGESPAAASSNPQASVWAPLSRAEIRSVLESQ